MNYEKLYKEVLEKARECMKDGGISQNTIDYLCNIFPELEESEDEQNAVFEALKSIHLRMEHQTVCNDAGGNRMWRRAWQHVNEAINIIKEDKEAFKW